MVEQPNNTGIVYILTNEAMDGYIKIGMTSGDSPKDVQKRMSELDSTGVPRAFQCEYAAVVENYANVEGALHTAFGDYRVRTNREFFEGLAPFRVKAILKLREIKDVTPGTTIEGANGDPENEKPPKRPAFKFSMVGIHVGDSIQWADNPEISCEVINEKTTVRYEGHDYAISPLAKKLKGWKNIPTGPRYWLFEGETLQDRRERLEKEADGDDE